MCNRRIQLAYCIRLGTRNKFYLHNLYNPINTIHEQLNAALNFVWFGQDFLIISKNLGLDYVFLELRGGESSNVKKVNFRWSK